MLRGGEGGGVVRNTKVSALGEGVEDDAKQPESGTHTEAATSAWERNGWELILPWIRAIVPT